MYAVFDYLWMEFLLNYPIIHVILFFVHSYLGCQKEKVFRFFAQVIGMFSIFFFCTFVWFNTANIITLCLSISPENVFDNLDKMKLTAESIRNIVIANIPVFVLKVYMVKKIYTEN